MAEWIQMPFVVVSGVGRGMGVLDGVVIIEGEGAVGLVLGQRLGLGTDLSSDWSGTDVAYPCWVTGLQ